ncbi:MAG: hypothetical protein ACJ746_13700 [Bryobacteraceae bacterium]
MRRTIGADDGNKKLRGWMSQLHNLSAHSRARIDAKLAELRQETGHTWTLEVTKQPGGINSVCLLEIAIDGRITRPIALENNHEKPADRICRELDRLNAERELQKERSA